MEDRVQVSGHPSNKDNKYYRLKNVLWSLWWVVVYVGAIAVIVGSILTKRWTPVKDTKYFKNIPGENYTIEKGYIGLLIHMVGGTIGLFIGPFQFQQFIRKRSIITHKVLGYVYYYGMAIGLVGSIWLLPYASGGMTNKFAFSIMAVAWLVTNSMAIYYIGFCKRYSREVRIQLHREWMIRSYAATTGAITLRIWLGILLFFNLKVLKLKFTDAFLEMYRTVSWLGIVLNLIIAEVYIRFAYGPQKSSNTDSITYVPQQQSYESISN